MKDNFGGYRYDPSGALKEKYGDTRNTEIVPDAGEFDPEDFYADEEMVITISKMGYIKRTPLYEFRTQNRGGVGAKGSTTRDEDVIVSMFSASMHNTILFFISLLLSPIKRSRQY